VTEAEVWAAMRAAQLELEAVMERNGMRFTPLKELEAKRQAAIEAARKAEK
jgi:hypothetical protein